MLDVMNQFFLSSGVPLSVCSPSGARGVIGAKLRRYYEELIGIFNKGKEEIYTPEVNDVFGDLARILVITEGKVPKIECNVSQKNIVNEYISKFIPSKYAQGLFHEGFFNFITKNILVVAMKNEKFMSELEKNFLTHYTRPIHNKELALSTFSLKNPNQFFTISIVSNSFFDTFFLELSFKDLSNSHDENFSDYFKSLLNKKCVTRSVSLVFCYQETYKLFKEIECALEQESLDYSLEMKKESGIAFSSQNNNWKKKTELLLDYLVSSSFDIREYIPGDININVLVKLRQALINLKKSLGEVQMPVYPNIPSYPNKKKSSFFSSIFQKKDLKKDQGVFQKESLINDERDFFTVFFETVKNQCSRLSDAIVSNVMPSSYLDAPSESQKVSEPYGGENYSTFGGFQPPKGWGDWNDHL